jgi:hypothetical protein
VLYSNDELVHSLFGILSEDKNSIEALGQIGTLLGNKLETPIDVILDAGYSEDTKRIIREECGVKHQHFQVIMSKLRKAKIIVDNKINPRFIPNIKEGKENFNLMLMFTFNDVESI